MEDDEAPDPLVALRPALDDVEARRARAGVHEALFGHAPKVTVGRYEIGPRIGSGAMGVVYEAHDPELERKVAVKLLGPAVSAREDGGRRMVREARSLARLQHPNVVAVYDVGTADGQVFVAMELIEGRDLRAHLAESETGWEDVLSLYKDAGRGLDAAHRAGLVHRDFKPENVLVDSEGRVRVVDFGLARPVPEGDVRSDAGITREGAVVGTPRYMAPEVFDEVQADALSDQFSFCVALYEALYGQRPFRGDTFASHFENLMAGRIEAPPRDSKVPRAIHAVLRRGMARDRSARHADMASLLTALDAARGSERRSGSWAPVVVAGGSAVLVAVVVALMPVSRERVSPGGVAVNAFASAMHRHHTVDVPVRSLPELASRPTEPAAGPPRALWCFFHGDDYRLLDRRTRFQVRLAHASGCYECRKERRRERIAALQPQDCTGYAMCLPGTGCA